MMSMTKFFWKIREYYDFLNAAVIPPKSYIAGRNGRVYEIRESYLGRLVVPAEHIPLLDEITPGFKFNLPKIPGKLLSQTLAFFRAYCQEWDQNEVMTIIYWDILKKEYILDCPIQEVSKVHIHATFNQKYIGRNSERYVPIMHIHSHNTMEAHFSAVDNQNEKRYMLYMVVGRLDEQRPSISLRVGSNGSYINELPIEKYFNNPILDDKETQYPSEWDNCVSITM